MKKQEEGGVSKDLCFEFAFVHINMHDLFRPEAAKLEHWQPRSQSSSAISDVTSPVKLVGKIRPGRARFQASPGHSDSANRPGYEVGTLV